MKIARSEVGVRRVVFIEAAHGWVAKQDAPTAIGLQSVFVRVDDDGVSLGNAGKGAGRLFPQVWYEAEIPAVSSIDVDAKRIGVSQGQDFMQGIDGTGSGCAQ